MTRIIYLLYALAAGAAAADDSIVRTRLVASLASYHLDRDKGYCEVNPGIGLEHDFTKDARLHVGQYEGSKCRPISYIGASWCLLELRPGVSACGGVAAFYGYHSDRGKVLVAPVPALRVQRLIGKMGLNVMFLLPYDDSKGGLGLQATFE